MLPRPPARHSAVAAAGGLALLLGLLFVPLPLVLDTPVARYASDFLHAPLFAVLFLAARHLLRPRFRPATVAAATLAAAAGGFSEVLQSFTSRQASARDFAFDLLGIALAWTGILCWRRRVSWRVVHAVVLAGFAVAVVLLVARKASESRELDAMMPLLAGFEKPHELQRWAAKAGTRMQRTAPGHAGTAWALEVSCSGGATWPGVSLEDFAGDWRGYRWLEWSVHLPSGSPLELAVRLDDDQGSVHGTRYTEYLPIVPSREVYRIDLRKVAAHFREHPMNMARMTELHFFLDEPRANQRFSLDEVRLVP